MGGQEYRTTQFFGDVKDRSLTDTITGSVAALGAIPTQNPYAFLNATAPNSTSSLGKGPYPGFVKGIVSNTATGGSNIAINVPDLSPTITAATKTLTLTPGSSAMLIWDGTNWFPASLTTGATLA